ncbi:MAG: type II secretion system GspH family protein [Planctomycetota bacterium]|nr:type II secretion system GspH family protein [Planctomycetota bacterium]
MQVHAHERRERRPVILAEHQTPRALVHDHSFRARGRRPGLSNGYHITQSARPLHGFTLTELLVVIAIIAVLAGLIMPAIQRSQRQARLAVCASNLSQLYKGVMLYSSMQEKDYPLWLSGMPQKDFPANSKIWLCPLDKAKGTQGGVPDELAAAQNQYGETNDFPWDKLTAKDKQVGQNSYGGSATEPRVTRKNTTVGYNPNMVGCSYLYEWTWEKCGWDPSGYGLANDIDTDGDGNNDAISWRAAKMYEASDTSEAPANIIPDGSGGYKGDENGPKVKTAPNVPVIRCFWHQPVINSAGGYVHDPREKQIYNVRRDGAIRRSPPNFWWIQVE